MEPSPPESAPRPQTVGTAASCKKPSPSVNPADSIAPSPVIDDVARELMAREMAEVYGEARQAGRDVEAALIEQYGARLIKRIGLPGQDVRLLRQSFSRKLRRYEWQCVDMDDHQNQRIGGHGPMQVVSNRVLLARQTQLNNLKTYMDSTVVTTTLHGGVVLRIPMSQFCNSPERRTNLHYVHLLGLERFCTDAGRVGVFTTMTLPPEYHPNPRYGKSSWKGLTPADGHKELQRRRKNLQRGFPKMMGVRVIEYHEDGCPHMHALMWVEPGLVSALSEAIEKYFGAPPMTKIVRIDPTIGSAATYLTKYLLKATGYSPEWASPDLADTAAKYDAKRATWGGRSIQFFDIEGSVTIWQELRRIRPASPEFLQLTITGLDVYLAATRNDYGTFLKVLDANPDLCRIWYGVRDSGTKFIQGIVVDQVAINTHPRKWKKASSTAKRKVRPTVQPGSSDAPASTPVPVRAVRLSCPRTAEQQDLALPRPGSTPPLQDQPTPHQAERPASLAADLAVSLAELAYFPPGKCSEYPSDSPRGPLYPALNAGALKTGT